MKKDKYPLNGPGPGAHGGSGGGGRGGGGDGNNVGHNGPSNGSGGHHGSGPGSNGPGSLQDSRNGPGNTVSSSSLNHHHSLANHGPSHPHHNLTPRDLYPHQAINGYMPNGYALMSDPSAYSGTFYNLLA